MQAAPEPRAGSEADDALARERAFYDAAAAERRVPGRTDTYDLALLKACGDIDGLRVLELGCGAGDLSVELLRRGARLTAIDISPGMVELARSRAGAASFVVAPAEDTGLPDASFDLVVGKWVLHHVDVAAAAREVDRLLRPLLLPQQLAFAEKMLLADKFGERGGPHSRGEWLHPLKIRGFTLRE